MSNLSKSPERNTFQKDGYLSRKAEEGKTPENNEDVAAMVDYYASWNIEQERREADPEWQKNNMEYDLRSTDWILEKARSREEYAQNLYAAMCNNEFVKIPEYTADGVVEALSGTSPICSYSWRYAGGIVADMRQQGDYIDWYCSGIRNDGYQDDLNTITPGQYVSESVVTDEIRNDLRRLGWEVVSINDE